MMQRRATGIALRRMSRWRKPASSCRRARQAPMLGGLLAGRNACDRGRRALAARGAGAARRCRRAPHRRTGGDSRHCRLQATFRRSIMTVTLVSLLVAAGVLAHFLFRARPGRTRLPAAARSGTADAAPQHQHSRILQLEKLSALGTMVGGIAHQLNNPLVGVVNMAQLAERETDNPQQTRELLGEIRRAGEDCHAFVRRMLEFSKVSCFDSKPTSMAALDRGYGADVSSGGGPPSSGGCPLAG
jgi:signal transduction histidine kinase